MFLSFMLVRLGVSDLQRSSLITTGLTPDKNLSLLS